MVTAVSSGTNIDVNGLVSQLMAAERAPLAALQRTQAGFQAKISAYGRLQSSLAAVGDAARKLDATDAFRAARATVSDPAVLGANASAGAGRGTYSVEVQTLAQAQKLASPAFLAADSVVGTGTLTIQFGGFDSGTSTFTANGVRPALNLTIDAGNNTVAGVRDAINATNGGVRASIVNDGGGFRLALAAADGGTANTLKITTTDDDGDNTDVAGLSRLAFDPAATAGAGKNLTQNAAGQDAVLFIDGIRVTKSSNTISDAIAGLTLNLSKSNLGSPVTVGVVPDSEAMKANLDGFVKAYNDFNKTLKDLTFYDEATRSAGTLQGDATARAMQTQVRAVLGGVISGLPGAITRLPQIGLALQAGGTLALDSAKFNSALADPSFDPASLFAVTGRATDSRVRFAGAADALAPATFTVAVSQAASRGGLSGGAAAGLTIAAGVNDSLTLSVNGQAATITLAAGAYASFDALGAELQSRINGDAGLKSLAIGVTVSHTGGVLTVNSTSYGSGSTVGAASGSAAAGLFGSPTSSSGTDVAGTINGVAAVGSGQSLVSTGGLRLILASAATGALGSVSFTRGYGALLRQTVSPLTDAGGPIAARTVGLNASIKRNNAQQDSFNNRMVALEARYRSQFSSLDAMLSGLASTSSFLTQQISRLSNNR